MSPVAGITVFVSVVFTKGNTGAHVGYAGGLYHNVTNV
jgi:hypothetical protein